MSHQIEHKPYELIKAADIDRILALIQNGIFQSPSAIRALLTGQISIFDLDPTLQAFLSVVPFESNAIGDGVTTTFILTAIPTSGTDEVFINGILQQNGSDYTITGTNAIFVSAPLLGDIVIIKYKSAQALIVFVVNSLDIPYKNIINTQYSLTHIFIYGINETTSDIEVAKFDPLSFTQVGPAVNVNASLISNNVTTQAGGYLWATGAAGLITDPKHQITRIDPSTMASTIFPATVDTSATVASITTDGGFVYAFLAGGTLVPNSIAKINMAGSPVGAIPSGFAPGPIGTIDMAINTAGFLFVAYTINGQIRRYDTTLGTVLNIYTFTNPIRILPVNDKIYVLDGTTNTLSSISATNVVTDIITFTFTPTDMMFDGADLWVSTGDVLRKMDKNGTISSTITPATGQTIRDITSGLGFVWTTYSNDTNAGPNITKIFPGLPTP